ncbi:Vmc-like lipoprotein signal peptide domain-containing protein [Mycoplasmopsis cynos]
MNKYKKIFSGLGLLSISTLIGASVVACANKKFSKLVVLL